jgi:predicted Rossmann fold flavoprotein
VSIPGTKLRSDGPCLITHWGLSGPAILKLSARGARELADKDYQFEIVINWCGPVSGEKLDAILLEARESAPKRRVRNGLPGLTMPSRLWHRLAEDSGIPAELTWSNLTRDDRQRLAAELTAGRFRVQGQSLNKDEFVTAGGIPLWEVDLARMESRRRPGLYLVGELLDVDGVTGGFNFQHCWSSGWLAGQALAEGYLI